MVSAVAREPQARVHQLVADAEPAGRGLDQQQPQLADARALGVPVERPDMVETTALGAGMLAAVGAGLFGSLAEAARAMRGGVRRFDPAMDAAVKDERLARWRSALAAV